MASEKAVYDKYIDDPKSAEPFIINITLPEENVIFSLLDIITIECGSCIHKNPQNLFERLAKYIDVFSAVYKILMKYQAIDLRQLKYSNECKFLNYADYIRDWSEEYVKNNTYYEEWSKIIRQSREYLNGEKVRNDVFSNIKEILLTELFTLFSLISIDILENFTNQ